MSKVSAIKIIPVTFLTLMTTLSSIASAAVFVSYREVPAVITNVNSTDRTLTVETAEGATQTIYVAPKVKVATEEGRVLSLSSLKKGHNIVLKSRVSAPAVGEVKGKVLAVNAENSTVKVREHSTQNIVHVTFTNDTSISSNEFLASLRKGSDVTVSLAKQ